MSELPPSPAGPASGPPAGWYADPGGQDLRWWDGAAWTDAVSSVVEAGSTVPPPPVAKRSLMSVGDWLSRSFRLTVGSLGGYLPLILLVVIPWFLGLAVTTWYGLRDGVMKADFETGEIAFENLGGRLPFALVSAAMVFMLFLGLRLLYAYVSRSVSTTYKSASAGDASVGHQTVGASGEQSEAGTTEDDHTTLGSAARQWPSVTGATLARTLIYVVLYTAGWLAVLLSPFMILLAPVVVVTMAWFWVRHVLSNVAAAEGSGWRASLDLARGATTNVGVAVFGRLVSLAVVGFSLVLVANTFGSLAAAISGSQPDTPAEPFAEIVAFNDLFPSNPAALALSWVVLAIGVGAWQILSATAHTLLYLDLRGELDLASDDAAKSESASGGQ